MTRNRHLGWLMALVAALMLALPALPAYAAPTPLAKYDVRAILTSDGRRALLVAGDLPDNTPLPAQVAIAVPKGASLSWVGEILGGDASKDPQAQYTVQSGKDYDTVVFTLKQARVGQAEMLYPQGQSAAGAATKAVLDYIPNLSAAAVDLSIEVPQGAKVSGATGLKQVSVGGGTFYQKSFTSVKAGQKLSASVQYTGGTITPAQPQSGGSAPQQVPQQGSPAALPTSSSSPASPPVVLIVLVAIIAGTYYMMKRVSQPAEPEHAAEPARMRHANAQPAEAKDDATGADYFDDEEAVEVRSRRGSAPEKKRSAAKSPGIPAKTAQKPAAEKTTSPKKDAARKSASGVKPASGKKASNAANPSAKAKRSA